MSAIRREDWAVRHHLDQVDVRYHIVDGDVGMVQMVGRSNGKRTALWTHEVTNSFETSPAEFLEAVNEDLSTITACQPMDKVSLSDCLTYGTLLGMDRTLPFD